LSLRLMSSTEATSTLPSCASWHLSSALRLALPAKLLSREPATVRGRLRAAAGMELGVGLMLGLAPGLRLGLGVGVGLLLLLWLLLPV
jgi:hypothetical protein